MTPNDTRAPDLAARLGGLSPEKQALLAQRLAATRNAGAPRPGGIAPREDRGPAPLSFAQELLWLHEQMTPGTAAYHVPMARRVRGSLDADALDRALTALVARHASLRTAFVEVDGAPRQVEREPAPVRAERHDVSTLPTGEREAAAERLLRDIAARPFDLGAGAPFRAALVTLDDANALLLVVVHHIVFDGGSVGVLFRDLAALYADADAALAPLPIQLADYAAWERARLDDARLAPEVAWWRAALDGAPAGLDLPIDFPRPAGPAGPGARHAATLSPAARDAVRALAAAHDATPFMVLLAAFAALLHRYTRQADLVVGVPVAGRVRAETEGLVGYLANTLALRARFDADPSFADLVAQVRATALGAFDHADVPYEKLVRELRAGQPAEAQALFRVLFALQDASGMPTSLGSASLEPMGVDLGAAKFDLSVSAAELPTGVRVAIEYRSDLFRADTIARIPGHLETLLRDAAAAPRTAVSRLGLLTAAEHETILGAWNATARAYPAGETLASLLAAQAARTPDAVAVVDARRTLTYAELNARAHALARVLQAHGVGPGVLVGVCAERSVELVVALVAVVQAGGAYVPLDPDYPAERLSFMLEDAAAPVLLALSAHADRLPLGPRLVPLDDVASRPLAPEDAAPLAGAAASASDAAYMIYTSGSTGRPKGALNAHQGIVNRLRWMQDEYALGAGDVVLQKTPFSFDVSVWEFFWPLMTGARLVMAEPGSHRDPAHLASTIVAHGVTVCHFVPSMLRAFLADAASATCGTLRDVMASGEALAPDLVAAFHARLPGARLHNLYGPTECAVDVTYWPCPPTREAPAVVPIGRPVANTRMYVLGSGNVPQPIGVPGELHIGGVQVGMGYHGRPELTAERFVPDPFAARAEARMYRTGDLARWLPDGTIEYLGRLDFQVKVRGFRIELGEIEAALVRHEAVRDAVVVARDERLVGYVAADAGAVAATALREHLRATLPEHMVPSAFVVLERLPLSSNGKVDRRALPALETDPAADEAAYVAPRDDVEHVVAGVWAEVLKRERVSVEAGFFELGGHSLLATRIVGMTGKIFRTAMPLRRFFEAPSVAGMARALESLEAKPGQARQIAALMRKLQDMSPEERERLRRERAERARPDSTTG